jgi:hypothetical protein
MSKRVERRDCYCYSSSLVLKLLMMKKKKETRAPWKRWDIACLLYPSPKCGSASTPLYTTGDTLSYFLCLTQPETKFIPKYSSVHPPCPPWDTPSFFLFLLLNFFFFFFLCICSWHCQPMAQIQPLLPWLNEDANESAGGAVKKRNNNNYSNNNNSSSNYHWHALVVEKTIDR